MLDREAGTALPGACADPKEMHGKAFALIAGDKALAASIRAAQQRILGNFSDKALHAAWRAVLEQVPVRASL